MANLALLEPGTNTFNGTTTTTSSGGNGTATSTPSEDAAPSHLPTHSWKIAVGMSVGLVMLFGVGGVGGLLY